MKRAPHGTEPTEGPFRIDNSILIKIKKKSIVINNK